MTEATDYTALYHRAVGESYKLRQLLKESRDVFDEIKRDRGVYFNNIHLDEILIRINEVLK